MDPMGIDLWCDFECYHSVFSLHEMTNDQILQSSSNILWTNIIISYIYRPLKPTNSSPLKQRPHWNLRDSEQHWQNAVSFGEGMDILISERWDTLNLWTSRPWIEKSFTSIEHQVPATPPSRAKFLTANSTTQSHGGGWFGKMSFLYF